MLGTKPEVSLGISIFVFFPNPSTALNAVIKSLDLKNGDEILTTNHEYGALDKTWNFICKKTGAKYKLITKTSGEAFLNYSEEYTKKVLRTIKKMTKIQRSLNCSFEILGDFFGFLTAIFIGGSAVVIRYKKSIDFLPSLLIAKFFTILSILSE